MSNLQSPHTNSAGLAKYRGRNVELSQLQGETAIVQASDGGEVKVKMLRNIDMSDPFVEIVGKVEEGNVMSLLACTDLGSDFSEIFFNTAKITLLSYYLPKADKDLQNYNRCVETSEHPKFRHLFFAS